MSIIIQGASRGIGFAMTKHAYLNSSYNIIATCRQPEQALEKYKQQLGANFDTDRLQVLPLDITKEDTIQEAAKTISKKHGPRSVRALINCSGILEKPERSFSQLNQELLLKLYLINCVGPGLVYKHFMNLLAESLSEAEQSGSSQSIKLAYPILASISARVGSIEDNRLGGWMSYRCSKSALNMLTRCSSIELANRQRKAISVSLHPGTVHTDLSSSFLANTPKEKVFTPEQSSSYLWSVLNNLKLEDSGFCYAWDGKRIPF